jgi:hypothetical protein
LREIFSLFLCFYGIRKLRSFYSTNKNILTRFSVNIVNIPYIHIKKLFFTSGDLTKVGSSQAAQHDVVTFEPPTAFSYSAWS